MLTPTQHPFKVLGSLLIVTTLLVLVFGWRLQQRGRWLPTLPGDIGQIWVASEFPLSQSARTMLGTPRSDGRKYSNLLREKVEAHTIATASFKAYREPALLLSGYGFGRTAEKNLPFFGKDKYIRAMILRDEFTGQRILLYCWIQYKNGTTAPLGNVSDHRDVFPRLRLGLEAIVRGEQNCIVRVYTQIHPLDEKGAQARRNIDEVTRAIYAEMLRQGGNIPPGGK